MEKEIKSVFIASSYDLNIDKSIGTHSVNPIDAFTLRIEQNNLYGRKEIYLDSLISGKTYKAESSKLEILDKNESYVMLNEAIMLPEDISESIKHTRSKTEKLKIVRYATISLEMESREPNNRSIRK